MVLIQCIHVFVKSVACQSRMPRPLHDCRRDGDRGESAVAPQR